MDLTFHVSLICLACLANLIWAPVLTVDVAGIQIVLACSEVRMYNSYSTASYLCKGVVSGIVACPDRPH